MLSVSRACVNLFAALVFLTKEKYLEHWTGSQEPVFLPLGLN